MDIWEAWDRIVYGERGLWVVSCGKSDSSLNVLGSSATRQLGQIQKLTPRVEVKNRKSKDKQRRALGTSPGIWVLACTC